MIDSLKHFLAPLNQLKARVGIAVVISALYLLIIFYLREALEYRPLSQMTLFYFPLDIWNISLTLPGIAPILVAFYIFAQTRTFRRYVADDQVGQYQRDVFVGWGLLYLLAITLVLVLEEWFAIGLTLVIILIGYLGGARAGLLFGGVTVLILGTRNLISYGWYGILVEGGTGGRIFSLNICIIWMSRSISGWG